MGYRGQGLGSATELGRGPSLWEGPAHLGHGLPSRRNRRGHAARRATHLAVHAAQAGIPMVRLQKLLGHADPTMTMRYIKHAPEAYPGSGRRGDRGAHGRHAGSGGSGQGGGGASGTQTGMNPKKSAPILAPKGISARRDVSAPGLWKSFAAMNFPRSRALSSGG